MEKTYYYAVTSTTMKNNNFLTMQRGWVVGIDSAQKDFSKQREGGWGGGGSWGYSTASKHSFSKPYVLQRHWTNISVTKGTSRIDNRKG